MNIIYIHHHNPLPVRSGMDKVSYNLLRTLNQTHHVTLLFPCEEYPEQDFLDELHSIVSRLIPVVIPSHKIGGKNERLNKFFNLIKTYLLAEPYHCSQYYFPEVVKALHRVMEENTADLIQASSIYTEKYLRTYNRKYRTILGPIDDVIKPVNESADFVERIKWFFSARARKRQEKIFMKGVDFITYISGPDATRVKQRLRKHSSKIYHCPVYSEMPLPKEVEKTINRALLLPNEYVDPKKIIFIGNFSAQRIQLAVEYLVTSILPVILEKNKETELYIVGKNPTPEIIELGTNEHIIVTGEVSEFELVNHLLSAAVFVAPSVSGTGIKTKTLHAMSLGKAIVATKKEISGFDNFKENAILVADDPREFAEMVIKLLNDSKNRQILGQHAYQLYKEYYSEDALSSRISDIYYHIAKNPRDVIAKGR